MATEGRTNDDLRRPHCAGHRQHRASRNALTEAVKKFGISVEDYMLPARHQIQMVDPDGRLMPDSEQGTEPGHEYPMPGDAELMAAYEQLVVGRRVNDQNSALVRQGRMAVYPSSHGQEACQVAAALCLSRRRLAVPHLP